MREKELQVSPLPLIAWRIRNRFLRRATKKKRNVTRLDFAFMDWIRRREVVQKQKSLAPLVCYKIQQLQLLGLLPSITH
jgi:hypothetical protein